MNLNALDHLSNCLRGGLSRTLLPKVWFTDEQFPKGLLDTQSLTLPQSDGI